VARDGFGVTQQQVVTSVDAEHEQEPGSREEAARSLGTSQALVEHPTLPSPASRRFSATPSIGASATRRGRTPLRALHRDSESDLAQAEAANLYREWGALPKASALAPGR
jgi:hypothetical protein